MSAMRSIAAGVLLCVAGVWVASGSALAADVGISAAKLLILDKTATSGKAKVVFVSRDANIAKGPSANPADIDATLRIYTDDATENYALFELAAPWLENSAKKAKYLNRDAPAGSGTKHGSKRPLRKTRSPTSRRMSKASS